MDPTFQTNIVARQSTWTKSLRVAQPAELPVEQPTKIELVLNRKTATVLLHCASRQILAADVRFGSKADIAVRLRDVRFTRESGH
jgi:hypothetical protein